MNSNVIKLKLFSLHKISEERKIIGAASICIGTASRGTVVG